jgi:O-antigen ligase
MLVIARLGTDSRRLKEPSWLRLSYIPAFIIVLLAVLVSGSRAGLAMGGLALLVAGAMIWMGVSRSRRGRRDSKIQRWLVGHPRTLLLLFAIAIIALLSAFFGLERAPGLSAIMSQNAFEDLRFRILPILEQMIRTFWIFGIGFGSFEEVYHIYEPTALMFPAYVNQAHNDWAQLIIEGGLPAVAILISLFLWLANSMREILLRWKSPLIHLLFWLTSIAIICAASVVDYPLRVPAFQLAAIWLMLALALERREKRTQQEDQHTAK